MFGTIYAALLLIILSGTALTFRRGNSSQKFVALIPIGCVLSSVILRWIPLLGGLVTWVFLAIGSLVSLRLARDVLWPKV